MPRAPSRIVFLCESCQRRAKPRHLRRWSGRCLCDRDSSWTVEVDYTESDTEASVLGSLTAILFGIGWRKRTTYTNQMTAGGITPDVARYLTEKRSHVVPRVVAYIRLREQQDLQRRGAQACRYCDAKYVPSGSKPWHEQGIAARFVLRNMEPASSPMNKRHRYARSQLKPSRLSARMAIHFEC
jgi:hypothetical protein